MASTKLPSREPRYLTKAVPANKGGQSVIRPHRSNIARIETTIREGRVSVNHRNLWTSQSQTLERAIGATSASDESHTQGIRSPVPVFVDFLQATD